MRIFKAALTAFLVVSLGSQAATAASPAPISAEHGMVVSAHRLASDAGVAVLRKGGNAVDAAIAVAYALAVTFPEAGNIGGGGFMTIRLHDGRQSFIDFRETAPQAATATMYQDADGNVIPGLSTRGYRAVAIPGTVAGLELARTKYGTRPRTALMASAIRLARNGFVLDHGDAMFLNQGADDFSKDAPSAAIFVKHGRPWQKGDTFVQTDLGRMLQAISSKGPDAFYKGEIAERIVAASKAVSGKRATRSFKPTSAGCFRSFRPKAPMPFTRERSQSALWPQASPMAGS